jgi:ABC-type antimicrobial peptide transport system permease subunit
MRAAIEEAGLGLTYLAWMLGACGATALLLSVVGIYGVVAYSVARRTPEFGIRLALGATASDVLRLAMRQAAALTAVGLTAGLVLAALVSHAMSSLLVGVVSLDAAIATSASLGLGAVSLAAAYIPARRVLRLDPARILRHQ